MNRKSFKLIILLGLVLFLSVGYAVVNSVTLTVTGSASAMTTTLKTEFTGNSYISNPSKASVTLIDSKNIKVSVNDLELYEQIEIELEIINNEQDVSVQYLATDLITSKVNGEYFSITLKFGKGLTGTNVGYQPVYPFIAKPGEKVTGKAIIELIKTPITEEDNKIEFTLTTAATPYQE